MPVPPQDMLLFGAVVREGSFTRAARVLGITKQTVSERVAKLEERLGVRLLERTTRQLRLTDVGGRYYERVATIASQIDEANREAQDEQLEPSGRLRVSAPMLFGRRYLMPVVTDYLSRYPKTRVELVLADRRVSLVEEGFDLAIRVGPLDDSSLASRKLGEAHVHCVASPRFLARAPAPTPAELSRVRTIGTRPVETWRVGRAAVKVEPVLVVNDLELCCEAAVAGLGVAQVPAIVCRTAVAEGRLRVLFADAPAYVQPVHALFPSRQHLSTKVRRFLEAMASLVEPMRPLGGRVGSRERRPKA